MELTKARKIPPFDLSKCQTKVEKTTLTLWVDREVKQEYDRLQDASGNELSKHLVMLVTEEIKHASDQAG